MIFSVGDIDYSLTKSERKTMSIYVEPDGSVNVRAPKDASIEKINQIIEAKKMWIYKAMAELEELNRAKISRKVTDGEGFLLMGKNYRLKIKKDMPTPISFTGKEFVLDETQINKAKELFISFYKTRAKEYIPERVDYFKAKMGVSPKAVRVMELKNRWASISNTGINFHWKVILAPLTIIDYIIVHELAHTKQPNHSPEFWEIVEAVLPNFREKNNWLKVYGAALDI